jgi:hypothetical protein
VSSVSPAHLKKVSRQILDRVIEDCSVGKLPAVPLCEALRARIVNLAGSHGFHALMSRAHAKAKAVSPWLDAVRIDQDGRLELVGPPDIDLQDEEALDAQATLLSHLLGLLTTLIGPRLTLGVLAEAWPNFEPDNTLE